MTTKKQEKPPSHSVTSLQFLVIILITIALAVVLDFGHRAAANAELKKEVRRLERQVATQEAKHRALEIQREWVKTDGYVEEWARTEGVMVLEGEIPIVPIPDGQVSPSKSFTPVPSSDSNQTPPGGTGETSSHWQEWWTFFFGPDDNPIPEDTEG